MLHLAYGQLALARRAWFERRPASRRVLEGPVISVGNLSVGGTGKTPLVAALAQWLVTRGERPAILSRGYARRVRTSAVTVVSDGSRVLVGVEASGDEPLMLARAVPGALVLVCADRYAAGKVAQRTLGATVHLLDDGFQHVRVQRDLDVVVTAAGELGTDHVLPKGRLREPLAVLTRASVLVVVGADDAVAGAEAQRYGVPAAFGASRHLGSPIAVQGGVPPPGAPVVALSAIGRPAQFAASLRASGWNLVAEQAFRDHHWFSPSDLQHVARRVADAGAWGVVTTDKDAVRLEGLMPLPFAAARIPLTLDVPRWDALTALVVDAFARRRGQASPQEARR